MMIIVLILNLPIIYNLIIEPKIIAIKYNADENKKPLIFINFILDSPIFFLIHLIRLLIDQFFLVCKNNFSHNHQNPMNN